MKNKTIAVIVDKLRRREFIRITALISSKKTRYYGFNNFENEKVLLVIIFGKMAVHFQTIGMILHLCSRLVILLSTESETTFFQSC